MCCFECAKSFLCASAVAENFHEIMSGGGGDKGRNLKGKHYLAIVDIYIFGYNSEFYVAYKEQYVRLHLQ